MDPRTYYWNLLLVWPIEAGLRILATNLHLGGALAIVLFTVLVRTVLLPLSLGQMRAQRETAALKDELDAIKRRYGKDASRLREETAALYRERGINPAAGILPLLVQLPVLFALYAALRDLGVHEPAFQQPWLWLSSLQQPDTLHVAGYTVPGPLLILAAGMQWVQQRLLTAPPTPGSRPSREALPTTGQPAWAAAIGPLMLLWFGLSASAGLALYWTTQNLVGVAQRHLLDRWSHNPPASSAEPDGGSSRASRGTAKARQRPPGGKPASSRRRGTTHAEIR